MTDIDPKLLQWTTPTQRKWIESWIDLGTSKKAGQCHGVNSAVIRNALARVIRKAARAGYHKDGSTDHTAPAGYHSRGTSTLVDKSGNVVMRWHKTAKDLDDRFAVVAEALEGLEDRMAGRSCPVMAPTDCDEDLLAVYPMGDPHLGMYAEAAQAGENFNSEICRTELLAAVRLLASRAPPAAHALVINEGDFFNVDNAAGTTTRGTPQDTDVSVERMVDIGVDLMVAVIDAAKARHATVTVITVKGNHDDTLSYMLSKVLYAYYRNDLRVNIVVNSGDYTYHKFGKNLFGAAHGNYPKKITDLESIMTRDCDRNGMWESDQYRVWYTGHVHHDQVIDLRNCVIYTSRTLAPNSRWAHSVGYRSMRDMKCDVYHKVWGRRAQLVVGIEEIQQSMKKGK